MGRRERERVVRLPGRVDAGPVPEPRGDPGLVDRGPRRDLTGERAVDDRRVLGEPGRRVAVRPAAEILERLREVPVVQGHDRRDPVPVERLDDPAVVVEPRLVHRAVAFGQDPRPGDREPVRTDPEPGHEGDVVLEPVVLIARDVAGVPAADRSRPPAERVPDRHPAAVLADRALHLVRGRGGAPQETGALVGPILARRGLAHRHGAPAPTVEARTTSSVGRSTRRGPAPGSDRSSNRTWAASSPCRCTPCRMVVKRWVEMRGELQIVEPRERDVVRDRQTARPDGLEGTLGHGVVRTEDRVDAAVEELGRGGRSGGAAELSLDDEAVGRQTGALHRAPVAGEAILTRDGPPSPGDVGDPAVPQIDEVRGHHVGRMDVVDVDVARRPVRPPVPDEHRGQFGGEQPVDERVVQVVGGDDDAVEEPQPQDAAQGLLLGTVAEPQHHPGGLFGERIAHAMQELREVRVAEQIGRRDVHDDPDHARSPRGEGASRGVRSKVRAFDDGEDPVPGGRRHRTTVDDPRDGRPRDPAQGCELVERPGHGSPSPAMEALSP